MFVADGAGQIHGRQDNEDERLHQRDKNVKQNPRALLPYEKEDSTSVKNGNAKTLEADQMSGSEFLLSIAGIFSSGTTDTSERVEVYVAEALKQKYP